MIDTETLHLLRPAWLLALLLIPLLWVARRSGGPAGAWRRVCDAHLLSHLASGSDGGRAARWPLLALAAGWALTCVAMAGPTWEQLPQPAYREPVQTMLVLSLSPSMAQRDEAPSRLARARYELSDLLEHAHGPVGLVVFADDAYAAMPVTDDPQVIAEMVPLLSPDVMPGRGANVGRALDEARVLLERAGASAGRIVLLGDGLGDDPDGALAAAASARGAGFPVSALALGSDAGDLAKLAESGGGAFARPAADDRDVEALLAPGAAPGPLFGGELGPLGLTVDAWRDVGPYLLLIPLVLAPLAFRRGWAGALLVLLSVGLHAPSAEASPRDWFQRPDQRGAQALAEGRSEEASQLFEDPGWRAAALYRAGDFEGAAAILSQETDARSQYNRGNALARAGQLEAAVEAYDLALARDPADEDAQWNRDLVKKLLEQQQQQQEQEQQGSQGDSQQSQDQGDSRQQESQQQDSQLGDPGQQNASSGDSQSQESQDGKSEPGEQGDADAEPSEDPFPSDASSASGSQEQQPPQSAQSMPSSQEQAGQGASADAPDSARPQSDEDREGAGAEGEAGERRPPPADVAAAHGAGGHVSEADQETEQWFERVPDDPAGLLREKLRRRAYERRARALFGEER